MVGALLLAAVTQPSAQAVRTPADAAVSALRLGQFDEVEQLLERATDARSVALRSRAAVARGRYDAAQKMLAGPAASAPTSDAALELGLLYLKLGRRAEGTRLLTRLLDGLQPRSAAEYMRFGTAARAVGRLARSAEER
jgi:tetratricopeptide (TPR) repeat protein